MLFYAESSPSGMMISKDFVFSSKSCVGMLHGYPCYKYLDFSSKSPHPQIQNPNISAVLGSDWVFKDTFLQVTERQQMWKCTRSTPTWLLDDKQNLLRSIFQTVISKSPLPQIPNFKRKCCVKRQLGFLIHISPGHREAARREMHVEHAYTTFGWQNKITSDFSSKSPLPQIQNPNLSAVLNADWVF